MTAPPRRRLLWALTCTALAVSGLLALGASRSQAAEHFTRNVTPLSPRAVHPSINQRGDRVAYVSNKAGTPQVYVAPLPQTGVGRMASVSNSGLPAANPFADLGLPAVFDGESLNPLTALVSGPSMSVVGDAVAFTSTATNLISSDTNGVADVFVRFPSENRTRLVSVARKGGPANGPSWGASFGYRSEQVAFLSAASNLVKNDTNGKVDAFVRDLRKGKTTRVSVSGRCRQGNGDALDVDVAGGYAAFTSLASNLVARDTNRVSDVFVHKLRTPRHRCGRTKRVSVSTRGRQANGPSQNVSLGGNGKYLAFESQASNLVADDTNRVQDVFWRMTGGQAGWSHKVRGPRTLRVSVTHLKGHQANGPSFNPAITTAGRFVYFDSAATNIFPSEDHDTRRDVYHNDLKTRHTTLSSRRDGRRCRSGAFECTHGTALGGIAPSISYHGAQVVFTSLAQPVREGEPTAGVPGAINVMLRYLGPESAPPPADIR